MSIIDNGDVIIKVLSSVLTRLIDVNLKSQHQHYVTKFQSSYAPGISIHAYLERIRKYARCSDACFIVALIYIDRVIEIRNVVLTALNVHRILITSVLVSAKFFDDEFYNNAFYAKLGGVPAWEMNSLEMEFLHLVNFSLFVKEDCFAKYHRELRNFLVVGDIASGVLSPHVPSSTPPQLSSPPRDSLQMKLFTSQMMHPKQDSNALPIRPVVRIPHTSTRAISTSTGSMYFNNQQQQQRVVDFDDTTQHLNQSQSHNPLCVAANDSVQTNVHVLTSSLLDARPCAPAGLGHVQNTIQQQHHQQQASLWSTSIPSSLLSYAPDSNTYESLNVGVGMARTPHAQAYSHLTNTRSNCSTAATSTGVSGGGFGSVTPSVDDFLSNISVSVAASVFVDVKGYHVAVPNQHKANQPHPQEHTHVHNNNLSNSTCTPAPVLMQSSEVISGPQVGSQKRDPQELREGLLGYGHRGEFKFCPSSVYSQTPVVVNTCNVAGLVANPKQSHSIEANQSCNQPASAAALATTPCGFHLSVPYYQYNSSSASTTSVSVSAMDSPMEVYSLHSPLGCAYDSRFDQMLCGNTSANSTACGSLTGSSTLPCNNNNYSSTQCSVATTTLGEDHQNKLYANFPNCSSYGNGADLSGLLCGDKVPFPPSNSNNKNAFEDVSGLQCPLSSHLPILNQRAHSSSSRSFPDPVVQNGQGVGNVAFDHNTGRGYDAQFATGVTGCGGGGGLLKHLLHGVPDAVSSSHHARPPAHAPPISGSVSVSALGLDGRGGTDSMFGVSDCLMAEQCVSMPHVLLQSGSSPALAPPDAPLLHLQQHQSHAKAAIQSVVVSSVDATARFAVSHASAKTLGVGVGYYGTGSVAAAGIGVGRGGFYEQWTDAEYVVPVRVGNT